MRQNELMASLAIAPASTVMYMEARARYERAQVFHDRRGMTEAWGVMERSRHRIWQRSWFDPVLLEAQAA